MTDSLCGISEQDDPQEMDQLTEGFRQACYFEEVFAQSFKMTWCACVVMITAFSN